MRWTTVISTLFMVLRCLGWPAMAAAVRQVQNITRVFNSGDLFTNPDANCRPMHCAVFGAHVARTSGCSCQCPLGRPAFLQHIMKCSDDIRDCRVLTFGTSSDSKNGSGGVSHKLPIVFLPLTGQILNPSMPPDWESVGVKVDSTGYAPCLVYSVGYLTYSGWSPMENTRLFMLVNANGYTSIQWLGNKQEQRTLTGKVVQIGFQCKNIDSPDICAVFRVIGRDVESHDIPTAGGKKENSERTSQLGLVVGIVCGVLLAFTLMGVTVFWTICWKQQKERLARKIQLHVLLQQRMQEQNSAMFRNIPRPYSAAQETMPQATLEMFQGYSGSTYNPFADSRCWDQGNVSNGCYGVHGKMFGKNDQLPPPPPYPHNRKRLYFSPEFFDPKLMANPPPPAEEFLSEVRRMINLAKSRIRGRRYTPSLNGIPEEDRTSICSEQSYDPNKDGDSMKPPTTKLDGASPLASAESSPESADSGVSSTSSSTEHRMSPGESGAGKLSTGGVPSTAGFNKASVEGSSAENLNHWLTRINELEEYPQSQPLFQKMGAHHPVDFYRFFTRRPDGPSADVIDAQRPKEFALNMPMSSDGRTRMTLHPDMEPMMYGRRYSLPSLMPQNYAWQCRAFSTDISSPEDIFRLQMQLGRKFSDDRYFVSKQNNSLPKRLAHFFTNPELRVDCQDLFHSLPYAESLPRGKTLSRPGLHPFLFVNEGESSRPPKTDTSST